MFEAEKEIYLKRYSFEATRLKAVLFDMDGVLFDSMRNHATAWSQAMTQFGLRMTPEEVYMHEGRTGKSTVNILANRFWGRDATDEEAEQIYAAKCKVFNNCPEAKPMPGALELLNRIKEAGLPIYIVTGSGQHSLLDRLNENFPGIFRRDRMVTSFDVKHGKPDPEPYLMGLSKAGIEPWEAMVVENAPLGVRAAVAARIFTVAVNTGPLPDHVLTDEGANVLQPSMQALCDRWDDLFNCLKS